MIIIINSTSVRYFQVHIMLIVCNLLNTIVTLTTQDAIKLNLIISFQTIQYTPMHPRLRLSGLFRPGHCRMSEPISGKSKNNFRYPDNWGHLRIKIWISAVDLKIADFLKNFGYFQLVNEIKILIHQPALGWYPKSKAKKPPGSRIRVTVDGKPSYNA